MLRIRDVWVRYVEKIKRPCNSPMMSPLIKGARAASFAAGVFAMLDVIRSFREPHVNPEQAEAHLRACEQDAHVILQSVYDQILHEAPQDVQPLGDMSELDLSAYMSDMMSCVKSRATPDTVGAMIVVFTDSGHTQYVSTIDPTTAPPALRGLADRLERRGM